MSRRLSADRTKGLGVVVAVAVAVISSGCGGEGPAVTVFLELRPANSTLKTEDVVNFQVDFNGDAIDVPLNPSSQEQLAFTGPPQAGSTIVVWACENEGAFCSPNTATFVGCDVRDLVASDTPVAITIFLDAIATPPAACAGLL